MNSELFNFIKHSPTPFHAVAHTCDMLKGKGFLPLCESGEWKLDGGKGYYVTRNGSSVIAFRVPEKNPSGFMMTASHCDSPAFKIKENPELPDKHYVRLSTEKYGGMLCSTWLDRPLSVAGRIMVKTQDGVSMRLVDLEKPCAVIPNVAIHMNRNANDGMSYNPAVDMLPLYSSGDCASLRSRLAENAGVSENDILATDIIVYNPEEGTEWNGFISAPRLDDLQCAFSALAGFLGAEENGSSMPVYCLFDNEEVGSQTKQGAASTFLADTLDRVREALGMSNADYHRAVANSFLVSCDNAHAVHPNHPEFMDKNHAVYMNSGIVIKYNANQKYTSDAVSAAIFKTVCEKAGVPFQYYANRADMAGGSTLGNIANTHVSLNTVDIGLPQLAMHSSYETAGAKDTEYMVKALTLFYGLSLNMKSDGEYTLG